MYEGTPGLPGDQAIHVLECPRWVRAAFNGAVVADSRNALLLLEKGCLPTYYFPPGDVREEFLVPSARTTHCPRKGDASYWSLTVGERTAEDAVWSYESPLPGREDIRGYRAIYWDRVDHWYEEEEEILRHPRDPFKRVDAVPSSRHVQVVVDGTVVADSRRPVLVFETGLPTRYYLPTDDVRMDLLTPTSSHTICPYKGTAAYWTLARNGKTYEDLFWSYPDPIAEMPKLRGLMCCAHEAVDAVLVDGMKLSG